MTEPLKIHCHPKLSAPQVVVGFAGWMDGGEVSTGVVEYLTERMDARLLAEIAPENFYIYNFPGSMEMSALFRPEVQIDEGLVTSYEEPENLFHYDDQHNLIFFSGKEPNIHWDGFAEQFFSLLETFQAREIIFVGSVTGVVPHTRPPRLYGAVSDRTLMEVLERHDLRPSNYEGPASFSTSLMMRARARNMRMTALVTEVPPYVQGRNIMCIEAVSKKLAAMLGASIDMRDLAPLRKEFEHRLDDLVAEQEELRDLVQKMEKDYDEERREEILTDVQSWFEKQDIQFD
ncbi:MAG: PAC2 family protein [Candidatus Hydrogenedentota bacterium]